MKTIFILCTCSFFVGYLFSKLEDLKDEDIFIKKIEKKFWIKEGNFWKRK